MIFGDRRAVTNRRRRFEKSVTRVSAGMCFAIAGYGAVALHSPHREGEPRDGRMIRVVDHKG